MLKIGSVVDGKYKVLNEIGHGGMSTVYLAINEKANKPWAIKEVRKRCSRNFEVLRQSLIVETNLLKKLKHPNLPRIVDVIDSDEDFLIVMDYIEGNTLERLLTQEGAQPQDKVVSWAMQLCDVLCYLHSQSPPIIYRDMKPSNIMLKSDGSVVLIDFGTAREFKPTSDSDTTCLGTKGYAAPEQFGTMGQTDARTDIYCLGATMYHLLTGHNPSEPPYEMYPITKWKPGLSNGLEKIILKCTQKNPDDRYQSADELRYALEHYHDYETQVQQRYQKRLRAFAGTALASAVCVAAALCFGILAGHKLNKEYAELLDKADNAIASSNEVKTALYLYIEAIALAPQRAQAYHGYYNAVTADGEFSSDEENMLLVLNTSSSKYLQTFADKQPKEYADFCYEIGNAYWYYCDNEEKSKSGALSWFETAAAYYEQDKARALEYEKCLVYAQMGTFMQRITASQIEGNDAGMYHEYWTELKRLKELNDKSPESEFITSHINNAIISCITEYANYFSSDGVPKEELLYMLNSIESETAVNLDKELNAACRRIDDCYNY